MKWKLNTIDLDHNSLKVLKLILEEIVKCKYVKTIDWRISPSQTGFHIKFWCNKKCCKCRKLYDDETRITADLENRKEHERNILFDIKSYKNNATGETITKKAGNWHKYKK